MRLRHVLTIVALFIGATVCTGCGVVAMGVESPRIVGTNSQTIKFHADITDENGTALRGVTVQSQRESLTLDSVWGCGYKYTLDDPKVVDEALNYDRFGDYAVRIFYSKEGYEPIVVSYANSDSSDVSDVPPADGGSEAMSQLPKVACASYRVDTKDHPVTRVVLRHLPPPITAFEGEYAFLSNSYPATVEREGIIYPTAEHAFQAFKTQDKAVQQRIAALPTGAEAQEAGRALALPTYWRDGSYGSMCYCVGNKFRWHRELAARLMATGHTPLGEGPLPKEDRWGASPEEEKQLLRMVLEQVREELLVQKQQQQMEAEYLKAHGRR